MSAQGVLGIALVAAGLTLAIGFPDLRVLVFTGRPLGIVLAICGVWDIYEAAKRRPASSRTDDRAPE